MDQFLPVKKAVRLQMWQERINEFNSSGMHLKDWLEQNNITRDTYYFFVRSKMIQFLCKLKLCKR